MLPEVLLICATLVVLVFMFMVYKLYSEGKLDDIGVICVIAVAVLLAGAVYDSLKLMILPSNPEVKVSK
jgi:hypothetical protein